MTSEFSPEQLGAYVDGRLEEAERARVRAAMGRDAELAERVRELQRINELAARAYRDIPVPDFVKSGARTGWIVKVGRVAASIVILLLGGTAGWLLHDRTKPPVPPAFAQIARIDPGTVDATRILLHISTTDPERVNTALDTAERILRKNRGQSTRIKLEIVANAEGLSILREGSPYAKRIHDMVAQYDNVSFKACGIAMETARLKEGIEVKLIPEAERVNAALDQILTRLQQGWLYIRA